MSPDLIRPRAVPLGGLRAMTVRRTLPSRERSLIGAWCFLDHYGPDDVALTGGMAVPAHPHTGLQTVSWLFTGEIDHADSAGNRARIRPGELHLMTAGRGINHSEFATPETHTLHGCQLWLALPDAARRTEPGLASFRPEPTPIPGGTARVFLGEAFGARSPVRTFTQTLGAEITLDPSGRTTLPLQPDFEYGLLADTAPVTVTVEGDHPSTVVVGPGELLALETGSRELTVMSESGGRVLLLGGTPLGEHILMWWNFVGRSDAEIRAFRHEWQSALEHDGAAGASGPARDAETGCGAGGEADAGGRFGGLVSGSPIPAPELPGVRLRPRG